MVELSTETRNLLTEKGVEELHTIIADATTAAERLGSELPDLWLMEAEEDVPVIWVSAPLLLTRNGAETIFRAAFMLSGYEAPGVAPGTEQRFQIIDGRLWSETERPRPRL